MRNCPQEVLYAIARAVSESSEPPFESSLDPLYDIKTSSILHAHPSSIPPSYWSEAASCNTLASLCLVDKEWNEAARPWLWHRLHVRLPRSWLAMLEEITAGVDEPDESDTETNLPVTDSFLPSLGLPSPPLPIRSASLPREKSPTRRRTLHEDEAVHESILATLSRSEFPMNAIPPELLSPPASRDPSPNRPRATSPGRWRLIRAVNRTAHHIRSDLYIPTPDDPSPGRHVRHLDFNHFRTVGMRRYVGEGVQRRFVTEARLTRILREMPNLFSFGATEFMDSAISFGVLTELILRGISAGDVPNRRGRGITPHDTSPDFSDADEDAERRAEYKALKAIDLCGCISPLFLSSLQSFVDIYITEDGRTFAGLKRLGLRGVTSVPPETLTSFVSAFPSLTHLDLSGTRASPELLAALATSSVELQALALDRCPRLTSESITAFLVQGGKASARITQLSLYGDVTYPSPLTEADLEKIMTDASCFKSGLLEYLDLSSAPLTSTLLSSSKIPSQPYLRSLGLSHIPTLPLSAITSFILARATKLEILTLVNTSPELVGVAERLKINLAIHNKLIRTLCKSPFRITGLHPASDAPQAPTNVRVLELGKGTLSALGAGAESWKIVRSRGGRAWYVDGASGWVNGVLERELGPSSPLRTHIAHLAACDGNVDSSVGWHARKMEVLRGQGMLGREDGLYGAVSFAYVG